MGSVFASCGFAVVAREAFVSQLGVVDMNNFPAGVVVAIRTIGTRWRMFKRFACRHITIVAAGTGRWHALEHTSFMTLLTGHIQMGALERKTRELVIE